MKKVKRPKLNLAQETVRLLGAPALGLAAGGAPPTSKPTVCNSELLCPSLDVVCDHTFAHCHTGIDCPTGSAIC